MTRHPLTLTIGTLILLCSSVANGQELLFAQFDSDSSFTSDSVASATSVKIGGLPSDFVKPAVVEATPTMNEAAENHFAANLAVLAAFASLLALGGVIVAYVGFVRRKARNVTPMRMVGA